MSEDSIKPDSLRMRQRRAYLRSEHRCVQCRKQDAFTLIGKSKCAECVEKHRIYGKKRRDESQEAQESARKSSASYRKRHKQEGKCSQCSRKVVDGHTLCGVHMRKVKERSWRTYGIPKYILGVCLHCGAERLDGYRYCVECLPVKREQMDHARQFVDRENQPFRKSINEYWRLTRASVHNGGV